MKSLSTLFVSAILLLLTSCEMMPYNILKDCQAQCKDSKKSKACYDFCDCIHIQGEPLDSCLAKYNKAPDDTIPAK